MSGPLGIFGCRSQPVNLIVFSTFKVSLILDSHTFLLPKTCSSTNPKLSLKIFIEPCARQVGELVSTSYLFKAYAYYACIRPYLVEIALKAS